MLAQVPADSPYLVAMLDPMPEAVRKQMYSGVGRSLDETMQALRSLDRAQLSPPMRAYLAILDELAGKDIEDWSRELGLDPSGRFVLYGLSVWPVFRMSVADEARVSHLLSRGAAAIGASQPRMLRGRSYWQLDWDGLSLVASVADRQLVFALLPQQAVARYLPTVLGFERPARSLQGSDTLASLIARYKFMPSMIGYVETRLAADILTGRAASSNTELDQPLRTALGPVADTCRTDIDRLAGYVPRMVFGYRRLDTRGMYATFALELEPAIASALQRLRTNVPELADGRATPGMMTFGVAANLDEVIAVLRRATAHVRERPFGCAWFAGLGEASARLESLLDTPLPPALHGLRGASIVLEDATLEPFIPHGHAILVGDHAHDLVSLALRTLGLGGTAVAPDGRPVPLPLAQLGAPPAVIAHVASRLDRAAFAVGPSSATEATEVLSRPASARSPLFAFGFESARMVELGWIKAPQTSGLREIVFQLATIPEGLTLDMFGTFEKR